MPEMPVSAPVAGKVSRSSAAPPVGVPLGVAGGAGEDEGVPGETGVPGGKICSSTATPVYGGSGLPRAAEQIEKGWTTGRGSKGDGGVSVTACEK